MHVNCEEAGCSRFFCTYSDFKCHLSQAHGDSDDSHPLTHFEFEPVAIMVVEPAVPQPVNVHHLVTVSAHSPVDKINK